MLTNCANRILRLTHNDPNIIPTHVGLHWAERFLERHPEYYIRKQRPLEVDRKNAEDPDFITDWFEKYSAVRGQYYIQDGDCYNFDETGFRIGIGGEQWIITRDPTSKQYLASTDNRELVTAVESISGDGHDLPPMLITSGKLHQERWYSTTELENDVLIGLSESGYSNDELSMQWLRHFERFSVKRQKGTCRLLLFDGYGSHATKEFITFCDNHRIIPFCLPPHTTHFLQPLDVVVFQPYKHFHREAVDAAMRAGCWEFNKLEFFAAITSIRKQTFKRNTVLSALRKTGLIPYNPSLVIDKLRGSPQCSSVTPPPQPQSKLTTPLTIRTLRREACILESVRAPQPFKERLEKFIRGSEAQVMVGHAAMEQLGRTKAASNARRQRENAKRKVVQKGGVLYAGNARNIVQRREHLELRRQQIALKRVEEQREKKLVAKEKKARILYKQLQKELVTYYSLIQSVLKQKQEARVAASNQ